MIDFNEEMQMALRARMEANRLKNLALTRRATIKGRMSPVDKIYSPNP
jgi:hypothetical protein